MNHADVLRQNAFQAVSTDDMRMAAAELHKPVISIGTGFFGDIGNELFGELFVTVLGDVLHAGSPVAEASEAKEPVSFEPLQDRSSGGRIRHAK